MLVCWSESLQSEELGRGSGREEMWLQVETKLILGIKQIDFQMFSLLPLAYINNHFHFADVVAGTVN